MSNLDAALASTDVLTHNQLADLLEELLPEEVPALTRAVLSASINALPSAMLPEASRMFREGLAIAREQGIDAFAEYLRGLGVPEEMIGVVKRYAPQ